MTKDEALRLAIKALKTIDEAMPFPVAKLAIKECKAALEAKGEPVAFENWLSRNCPSGDAESVQRQWESSSDYADLYTTPPPRKPLTEIALLGAYEEEQKGRWGDHVRGLRAIEAAHGINGEA